MPRPSNPPGESALSCLKGLGFPGPCGVQPGLTSKHPSSPSAFLFPPGCAAGKPALGQYQALPCPSPPTKSPRVWRGLLRPPLHRPAPWPAMRPSGRGDHPESPFQRPLSHFHLYPEDQKLLEGAEWGVVGRGTLQTEEEKLLGGWGGGEGGGRGEELCRQWEHPRPKRGAAGWNRTHRVWF